MVAIAVVAALSSGLAGQRTIAEMFACPMHPDVRAETAGTCPRCGMRLVAVPTESPVAYVLETRTTPAALRPAQKGVLSLRIRHPKSEREVRLAEVHQRVFHLFVVTHDLQHFEHVHPSTMPDGSLEVPLTLPRAGAYQLYADFLPEGGTPQLLQRTLLTAAFAADPERMRARLKPDLTDKTDAGMTIALQLPAGEGLVAGREEMFRFRVSDAETRSPVTDLEPFLGAAGHALIISEDLADAVHSHPVAEFSKAAGPDIVFDAVFPRPGLYKLWAQFQRGGRIAVAAFTLPVSGNR